MGILTTRRKSKKQRALNAVLDELPNVRLDADCPTPHLTGAMMRTPKALPVVFG